MASVHRSNEETQNNLSNLLLAVSNLEVGYRRGHLQSPESFECSQNIQFLLDAGPLQGVQEMVQRKEGEKTAKRKEEQTDGCVSGSQNGRLVA